MHTHVFLSGPMGAGKSTVGPELARAMGRAFLDLDEVLERETGMRVAEIFRSRGEATFRRLEEDAVRRVAAREEPLVVALGGGTVEDAGTRSFLLERGVLITLTAPVDVLVQRALRDPRGVTHRPLLAGDSPHAALAAIVRRREAAYAEAHRVFDTSRSSVPEVVEQVARHFDDDASSVVVRLGTRSYRVVVREGALERLADELDALGASRAIVVTDANVATLAPAGGRVPSSTVVLAPGEAHKTLASVEAIWDAALGAEADRASVVVAVGGGVVGDLAGFAAATLLRGVRFVQVPTSLLAMVDSSVGGKTGFDRGGGKNLVGAFWQPSVVLCDARALATLPARELRAGLAEVVKTAWIEGEDDVAALERDAELLLADGPEADAARSRAIRRAVRTKARIVALDELERNERRWLNLGHTFGHALEAASGFAWLHGEAVAAGLVAALRVSVALGAADASHVERCASLLGRLGLPTEIPASVSDADLARWLAVDKKRERAAVRFVVAGAPSSVRTEEVPLAWLSAQLPVVRGA